MPEDLLDAATLLAGCGGDSRLLRKMIKSFQRRAPEYVADLEDAAQRSDDGALRQAAHRLRGLVSTFSTSVAETIERIEQGASASPRERGPDCAAVAHRVAALCDTISTLSVADLVRLSNGRALVRLDPHPNAATASGETLVTTTTGIETSIEVMGTGRATTSSSR